MGPSMPNPMLARSIALVATLVFATAAHAANQTVAYDYSHHEIALNVSVKGRPLYVLLDTGVDPSVIDLGRAKALGLPVQDGHGGEGSGEGNGHAHVFPATIKALAIDGQAWGDVDALAMDMAGLSKSYGRPLDGVLGYSFLVDKTVVIDYPSSTVAFYKGSYPVGAAVKQCKLNYQTPLVFAGPDDRIPVLPDFRFGGATAKISLDTGSNRGVSLFPAALGLKGVRVAIVQTGKVSGTGARGGFTGDRAQLNLGMGVGEFTHPAGSEVTLMPDQSKPGIAANLGNPIFADMKVKLVIDYPGKKLAMYGDCGK
ncbi:MAG TPA: retropepsin-like aspartic protease [Xanthomonadaceae bacterium]|nr:retropepsin-like aspartic protease [Xanthomonadaceae bacterium]